MKLRNAFTVLAFAIILTGCASLGNERADTFPQKFAYATGINKGIVEAVTSSASVYTLSSADAEYVLKAADNAHEVLVTADQAYQAGDTAGAQSKLAVALTALTALQDYLRAHGAKP